MNQKPKQEQDSLPPEVTQEDDELVEVGKVSDTAGTPWGIRPDAGGGLQM